MGIRLATLWCWPRAFDLWDLQARILEWPEEPTTFETIHRRVPTVASTVWVATVGVRDVHRFDTPALEDTWLLAIATSIAAMDVTVYGQLRAATGSKTVHLEGDVETVGEAVDRFLEAYPRAKRHVCDENGDVRPSVRIMLDGERVELESECPPDASLRFFPAMQGGSAGE